jgi:ketosteroid isomerase-like protein
MIQTSKTNSVKLAILALATLWLTLGATPKVKADNITFDFEISTSPVLGQDLAKGSKSINGGLNTATAAEILQLERAYDQAFIKPTVEQMDRFHTDDFMMTARGMVTTKAQLLARLKDPAHKPLLIESLTSDDLKVRIYGYAAVSTGRWKRISKDAEGKDTSAAGFFTHVWLKGNMGWQLAVAHYSLSADQVKR